jgi:UDP-N-acetylglucosamine transferase subunit ALG13
MLASSESGKQTNVNSLPRRLVIKASHARMVSVVSPDRLMATNKVCPEEVYEERGDNHNSEAGNALAGNPVISWNNIAAARDK